MFSKFSVALLGVALIAHVQITEAVIGTLAIAAAIPSALVFGPPAATVIGGVAAAIGAVATGAFIGVRGKRDVSGLNEVDIANTDVDLR